MSVLPGPASVIASSLFDGVVDLVLPADCAVCGLPGVRLCPECTHELVADLGRVARAEEGASALPLGEDGGALPVVASAAYAPPVSTALLAFKDHHALHLRSVLGPALARAVATARLDPGIPGSRGALLVPVPGSAAGFRRRGYDPLHELTTALPGAWILDDVVRGPPPWSLVRGRRATGGPAHAGSGAAQRRRRARDWRVRDGALAAGTPVLLLDDVLTTGSTLAHLAAAVRRAGGRPVGAVVLAAVRPPDRTVLPRPTVYEGGRRWPASAPARRLRHP